MIGPAGGSVAGVKVILDSGPLVSVGGVWRHDGPADEVLDLRPFHVVRGLVDAHAHLGADGLHQLDHRPDLDEARVRAFAHLESGVFLVLEKGGRDGTLLRLASEPPADVPDLEMAGRMLAPPGGYYEGYVEPVAPADLARAVADAAVGARWVKLVGDWPRRGEGPRPNFTTDDLATAVAVAHAAGCRVAIHTAAPDTPSMAVAAGVDSIEHGLFLTEEDVRDLGARGGTWVPTLHAMTTLAATMRPGSSGADLFACGIANASALLEPALEAGVTVLCGTDLSVPHGQVAVEAAALAAAGMSADAVVHAVTEAGWAATGRPSHPGPGVPADLVAFDGDPRHDLDVLGRPALVVRAGRVLVDRR